MRTGIVTTLLVIVSCSAFSEDFGGTSPNPFNPLIQFQEYEEHHAINNPYPLGDSVNDQHRQRADQWRIYFRSRKAQLDIEAMREEQAQMKSGLQLCINLLYYTASAVSILVGCFVWDVFLRSIQKRWP